MRTRHAEWSSSYPNRLNVATSRARCISIMVSSPQIFEAEYRTPWQIRLANAFCRYLEMAEAIEHAGADKCAL